MVTTTEPGGAHRLINSRVTRRHMPQPVSGTSMPKLCAYTFSRGSVMA